MKLIVYNDVHIASPHQTYTFDQFKALLTMDLAAKKEVYLLGDIIDAKNCRKDDVLHYLDCMNWLILALDERYLFGNHEAQGSRGARFIKHDNVILAHGDFEAWGEERAIKFRNSKHGAGRLKRTLVSAIDEARLFIEAKLSQEHIDRACTLMRDNGCSTYICGHKHSKERIVHEAYGMKIIALPRGRNEIEL